MGFNLEYALNIDYPETGSKDKMSISVDLTTHPGVDNIIDNFYRFLLRIGIEPEILDEYISFPDEDEEDDEENHKPNVVDSDKILEGMKTNILNNASDEEKRISFLDKMKEDESFLKEVFKLYLGYIFDDE